MSMLLLSVRERQAPLLDNYAKYYAHQGVNISYVPAKPEDPLSEDRILASYSLGGEAKTEFILARPWAGLWDRMDAIAKKVHIDKIGIAENERREFLKKHDLGSVLDSYATIKTPEAAQEACTLWLLAKF